MQNKRWTGSEKELWPLFLALELGWTNFAWWFEKVCTDTTKWIVGKSSGKQSFYRKMLFTASWTWKV